ncbi:MAG: hypothetical protein M1838_005381 [Thelocarpon superellum]|nr:MAG: hypothetical protein M1838_005381 [Thelocarpon superellum]
MYVLAPGEAYEGAGAGAGAGVYFDASKRTRALARIGLMLCWVAGVVELAVAVWMAQVRSGAYLNLNGYAREVVPLLLNVVVTIINETLGYIHATSLRWALQREGRLAFNSNLRLFTSAHSSRANAWYCNVLMLFCIIMSYASTSLLFIGDLPVHYNYDAVGGLLPKGSTTFVCGFAMITLGIGIIGQCIITTLALRTALDCPTWSPNPLDTAAACVAAGTVRPAPGRCLRSVHDQDQAPMPVAPRTRQPSSFHAHKEVRYVFYALWGTVVLTLAWGVVLVAVIRHSRLVNGMYNGTSWSFFPFVPTSIDLRVAQQDQSGDTSGTMTLAIPWDPIGQFAWQDTARPYVSLASFCWAFALMCLLQTFMTLSLHCAELLINVIRDEQTWRLAGKRKPGLFSRAFGLSRKPMNALHMLFLSAPALALFLFKPVLHWIFGLAVSAYFSVGMVMRPPQIFYLCVGGLALAFGVTACAFWRPPGPQPATYGHIQTLVDLVDEWPEMDETMFWGRKMASPWAGGSGSSGVDMERERATLLGQSGGGAYPHPQESPYTDGKPTAHAGTSDMLLDEVRPDEYYMGEKRRSS